MIDLNHEDPATEIILSSMEDDSHRTGEPVLGDRQADTIVQLGAETADRLAKEGMVPRDQVQALSSQVSDLLFQMFVREQRRLRNAAIKPA